MAATRVPHTVSADMTLPRIVFVLLRGRHRRSVSPPCWPAVLAPGGWTPLKAGLLLCFAGVAPWLGVCVGNALPGFRDPRWRCRGRRARCCRCAGDIEAAPITARTALAVTIRASRWRRCCRRSAGCWTGLAAAGVADRFALFILSDTATRRRRRPRRRRSRPSRRPCAIGGGPATPGSRRAT